MFTNIYNKRVNRNLPPKRLKRNKVINIENPEFFQMENGLRVLIVENHKLPIVRIGLEFDYQPFLEKYKSGIRKIFSQMLRAGTKNYSKEELDDVVDYMGINLYTSFSEIFVCTLKKYLTKSVSIISDIVINNDFDNSSELERIIKQRIIDINISEKDPNSILERVKNILYFGSDHPYGEYETEESIKNITSDDLKKIHNKYYVPNISYISFIGDISRKEVEKLCNLYFSTWEKKTYIEEAIKNEYNIPSSSEINIIDLPSTTQSSICIGSPVHLRKNDVSFFSSMLANGILGGSAQSRLFLNLREKKAYTYGAYSILKSDKYIGCFSVYTQVRNEVTDEAIKDILKEISNMAKDKVSSEELNIKKNEISGQFILDLEDLNRVSDLFICELKNELPKGFYKNYLNNIKSVTIDDVYKSCNNEKLFPNKRIIIVGKSTEIFPKIKKLGIPIRYFDKFGNPLN
ncbi:M16 family metallopeptidase [Blattabacterium cuenoti]|uniref:M16 family metallopeptidase n=1 Tax=Blattabacterium cuenoti TaxID=1653831 RepID=UPI00163C2918|nr:pitrilysin family protein [Blattabacterium cuenoti]